MNGGRPSGVQDTGAIPAAVHWVEGILSGTLAISAAVVAVAAVGLLMLYGRIDVARAARVLIGCFIILGASAIASGIQGADSSSGAESTDVPPQTVALPPPVPSKAAPDPYDPYAGTALPER